MKKTAIRLILAALMLTLTACGRQALKNGSLEEIYQDMRKQNVLPTMLAVSADTAFDFYGIDRSDYDEAVMYIAEDSLRADEVLLFRAKNAPSAERIKQMLSDRMTAKANEAKTYSPEQYAIIGRGEIIENGLSLALIVSPSVEQLTAVYRQYAAQ